MADSRRLHHPRAEYTRLGWLTTAVTTPYNAATGFGWFAETATVQTRSSRRYVRDTNDYNLSWDNRLLDIGAGFAAIQSQTQSFRNVRNRSLYLDGEQRPNQGNAQDIVNEWDPELNDWYSHDARMAKRPNTIRVAPSIYWIPQAPSTFDPATFPQSISSEYPRRSRPLQMSWTKSGFFVAIFFNPAQQGWTINSQLVPARPLWTSGPPNVDWLPPELTSVFDATLRHWQIDSQLVPGKPYWTSGWQGNDWLTPELLAQIAYDPAQATWTIESRPYKSRAYWTDSPQPQAWMVPAVLFDVRLWPATNIHSHRQWERPDGRWQPDLDQAWQGANPVVPNTFNPSFATEANSLDDAGGSPIGSNG